MKTKRLEEFKEYTDAKDKLEQLKTDLHQANGEIAKITSLDTPRRSKIDDAALMLLSRPEDETPEAAEQLDELRERQQVIERAIAIQTQKLGTIRASCSKVICEQVKPKHQKIVKDLAEAIVAATKLCESERDFRDRLFLNDITLQNIIRPMAIRSLGLLDDPGCAARLFLKEAIEHGYLTQRDSDRLLSD